MNRIIIHLIISLLLATPCFAVGQAGLEIDVLKAGVGARALGMGSAFTAIADNSDAPFWNPAGLAQINFHEITTMQTKLSTDADHYYISYVQPAFGGAIGISWVQVSMGDIYETGLATNEYNEVVPLGIFSYFSNAYMLAYGQKLNKDLSWGITGKYLQADMPGLISAEGGSAYGYSITPGILWKPSKVLSIGFKIDELVNEQKWGTGTEEHVPPKYRLGMAYLAKVMGYPILFSGDYSQIAKEGYVGEGTIGAELKTDGISIRLGLIDSAMTAGVGFTDRHISVDYAYVNQMALSRENVHRISLTGRW